MSSTSIEPFSLGNSLLEKKMKRLKQTHEKEESGSQENKKDTLSELPDCILLHILSFLNAKYAVQTCLLSTRWKNLWKNLPTLALKSYYFTTSEGFAEFVNQILSLRDASESVNALDFICMFKVKPDLLNRVVTYAVSRNVNRLSLFCASNRFRPSLFSCQSLTSLDISYPNYDLVKFLNSLNLPALTYLKLRHFAISCTKDGRVEPFSTFKRLNTLILGKILLRGAKGAKTLCILSTTLLNLSIELNETCIYRSYSIELSAPNLCSFTFTGGWLLKLYGSSLNSIKKISIDIPLELPLKRAHSPLNLLKWLINFVNITSLTVSAATLQVLSLVPNLLKVKSPCWYNLKSLKVQVLQEQHVLSMMNRKDVNLGGKSQKENAELQKVMKARFEPYLHIAEGIVDFLLQSSPSAEFEIVKYTVK